MAVESRLVRYGGPAPMATVLAQCLEHQGVEVAWEPILEPPGVAVDLIDVPLLVEGDDEAIKAGVDDFTTRFPDATVEIGVARHGGDQRIAPPIAVHACSIWKQPR